MNADFTVCHATYKRPQQAVRVMQMWRDRALEPRAVEYIFACNNDDQSVVELSAGVAEAFMESRPFWGCRMVGGDFAGSAPAWNAAATGCHGTVIIQAQDDVEPPNHWDVKLREKLEGKNPRSFVAVSDGYRKDSFCFMAIQTREYAAMQGHFICPDFRSVYSDDDAYLQAKLYQRDGKADLIEARDLVFKHQHHYHVKGPHGEALIPFDDTYARQNSAENYAQGLKLFTERNKRALAAGLKTW